MEQHTPENSRDGIASHGLNRFQEFIRHVQQGYINLCVEPIRLSSSGAWEQWDGNHGLGIHNVLVCTDRAISLVREFGIGLDAMNDSAASGGEPDLSPARGDPPHRKRD